MRQCAQMADKLHAIEFRQLVVGENHVDTIVARVLERAAGRVEQFEI